MHICVTRQQYFGVCHLGQKYLNEFTLFTRQHLVLKAEVT